MTQVQYLALLTLYENGFRILHWRIVGEAFYGLHEAFGDIYEKLGEFMDETAELMMTQNMSPVNSMQVGKILDNSQSINAIVLDPSISYDANSSTAAAAMMINTLYETLQQVLENESGIPDEVKDVYKKHLKFYRIEGMYKLEKFKTSGTAEEKVADTEVGDDVTGNVLTQGQLKQYAEENATKLLDKSEEQAEKEELLNEEEDDE